MTFDTLYPLYQPIVDGIAAQFGSGCAQYGADAEDFRQELTAWMWRKESWLDKKYAELDDADEFGKFLARCLHNESRDYWLDIRDQAGGQPRQDAYWYSEKEVEALLAPMFDPEMWMHPPQAEEGTTRAPADPATGGNWLATLADVARSFEGLGDEDKTILRRFHKDNARNKDVAEELELTEATMSYRHTRAVRRLHRLLGGAKPRPMRPHDEYDPWRGRHAISSARARAMQSSYYEED